VSAKTTRPEPTEVDWARLAAFIDGEGCIYINLHRQFYPHLNKMYERCYAKIVVTNTDFRIVHWLQDTFGGVAHLEKRRADKRDVWAPTMRWEASCKSAAVLLERCYQYLIAKREQADIIFEFQATVKWPGQHGHATEVWQRRMELRNKLHSLHGGFHGQGPIRTTDRLQ